MDRDLRDLLRAPEPSDHCPPDGRWVELLAGELEPGDAEALRRHLEGCPACAEVALDASRFVDAMGELAGAPRREIPQRRTLLLAAAAAVALVVGTVLLLTVGERRTAPDSTADRTAELAASVEVALPELGHGQPNDPDLLLRGAAEPTEGSRSLAAALVPFRVRQFVAACSALAEHGRRFPDDREGRYLAGIACLKAGETDRADLLLASLAASAGERREDARGLLERLRRARGEP